MDGQTAVLDLLFDKCDGVLKEELPEIQTLDFSSLGLLTNDFDDSLFDGLLTEEKLAPRITSTTSSAYTDHDYVMQPVSSPSGSDSGVSVDSNSTSPQCDNMSYSDANSMSGSPPSVSQYSPGMSVTTEPSPVQTENLDPLGLENFDIDDIADMNFDTIDTSALLGETPTEDKDVSIDLGNHSDLMTFDTSMSTSLGMDGSSTKTIKIIKVSTDSLPFTMKDVSTDTQRSTCTSGTFPVLKLTEEEKDLLSRDGITLPTNMPLTKEEERALKAVRRKIRNKISAKESRKRKMGYVDGLEKRVKICTQENQTLQKKVETLEKQNTSLVNQLRKLQSLLSLRSTRTTQASTCVVVLLLSFAFLVVPNFNPFRDHESVDDAKSIPIRAASRNLLENSVRDDLSPSDTENPYGISVRPDRFWENPPKTPALPELEGKNIVVDGEDSDINSDKTPARDHAGSGTSGNVNPKVVYVQIEKSVGGKGGMESNVTYVSSEAEFKPVETNNFQGDSEQQREYDAEVDEGPAVKKKRHDL